MTALLFLSELLAKFAPIIIGVRFAPSRAPALGTEAARMTRVNAAVLLLTSKASTLELAARFAPPATSATIAKNETSPSLRSRDPSP